MTRAKKPSGQEPDVEPIKPDAPEAKEPAGDAEETDHLAALAQRYAETWHKEPGYAYRWIGGKVEVRKVGEES